MQLLTKNLIKACISVYDGISPALLATISLSQNIKGSTHQQLVSSLKKSNIVQSQSVLSVLAKLDRALFTSQTKVYNNKPNKISKGQNMTDIFSHSIILNNIEPQLKIKPQPRILDIGTGHGYLAFAIWMLAVQLSNRPQKLLAIDCYEQCVSNCQQIKAKLEMACDQLQFQKMDIMQLIEKDQKYDIIVAGFFIEPNLSAKLQALMESDGIGIWPQVSSDGQGLYIMKKNKPKEYLLETLFSQQVVQSSVEDYFISEHSSQQQSTHNNTQQIQQLSETQKKILEQKIRDQTNQKKKHLQHKLKSAILKHQQLLNLKNLTLKQMQDIPQISSVLDQLKRYK